MSASHAAPISTIAAGRIFNESHGLMVGHRAEAQRILDKALRAGLPGEEALRKAGRAIRAGQRAQIMHLVELPHGTG
jgi:hypothetical protein